MKNFILALPLALIMVACGGNKSGNSDSEESVVMEEQPVKNGEYRALSFQYMDSMKNRMKFDGRIIYALDEKNPVVYVYENGNRTNFKATLSLKAPFEKTDSVYTATTIKDTPVCVKAGSEETDTLILEKAGKTVKVAFERTPLTTFSASEGLTRITNLLDK